MSSKPATIRASCATLAVAALVFFAACNAGAGSESQQDADERRDAPTQLDLEADFAALAGIDGRLTHDTSVAIERLVALGDEAVPGLRMKLIDLGRTLDEIKADQRLDSRGLPSYDHLDVEAAKRERARWATVNTVHGHVIRILQRIGTPAAQQALESYFGSRDVVSRPIATATNQDSTPAQLWVALEQILWCGGYDETARSIARQRMSADQNRRVRALAAHLAARAGLGGEALAVLTDMVQTPQPGPDGRDLHVLLGLAYLKGPDEVSTMATTRPFRPDDVELAVQVSRFERADDGGKVAMMRELKSAGVEQNPILDLLFAGHILEQERVDRLAEFGYVRPELRGDDTVSEQSARLFAVLGYDVNVEGGNVSASRKFCNNR